MFTGILWRFLILETFALGASCELICPYVHPQKVYCTSDIGQNINGTLYSDKCTSNITWIFVDLPYWRNLLIYYNTGCYCIDEIGEYRYENCRSIYSYMKSEGGICRWQKTADYNQCRRNERQRNKPLF